MTPDAEADDPDRRESFSPPIPDRFEKHVRDDHRSNQVLHDVLQAAADPDVPVTYNFQADKGPAEDPDGPAPRYHVVVGVHMDETAPPYLPDEVRQLLDQWQVHVTDVYVEGDELRVNIRPIERTVEPVQVPVRWVPDDVKGVPHERLRQTAIDVLSVVIDQPKTDHKGAYEAASALATLLKVMEPDTDAEPDHHSLNVLKWLSDKTDAPWEFVEDGRLVSFDDAMVGTFEQTYRAITYGDGKEAEVPEFDDPEDAIEYAAAVIDTFTDDDGAPSADGLSIPSSVSDDATRTTVPCGCGDYVVKLPSGELPETLDVVCPECGDHFGFGDADDVGVDYTDAWPAAKTVTAYECHACECLNLPSKFYDDDGPRCPRCGEPVDWERGAE